MAAGTVRDWTPEAVRLYLRTNGKDIAKSAMRGDKISLDVWVAYKAAFNAQAKDGSREALSLRDALNSYVIRDLNTKEREELAGRFGHRVEGDIAPTLILPPGMNQ